MTKSSLAVLLVHWATVTFSTAFSHWYLDPDDGFYKPLNDSVFALGRGLSGDVGVFKQQEEEREEINKLGEDLSRVKEVLEEVEAAEKQGDLEEEHYRNCANCTLAGKKLQEFDLFQTTVIHPSSRKINTKPYYLKCTACLECRTEAEHARFAKEAQERNLMPYCTVINEKWRMNPFDHLEGMQAEQDFQELPEHALTSTMYFLGNAEEEFGFTSAAEKARYKNGENLDEMGHCITIGLSRDHSDWVLFNLASIFWRIRGFPREALECDRRAYLLAPEQYRDMALVNIANILHKQGYTKNATVLMKVAAENYPHAINHFALGNMYSVVEDYRRAIIHYSAALKREPTFEEALLRRHAVMCQAQYHVKLEKQFQSLNKTLFELEKYKRIQEKYQERVGRLKERQAASTVKREYHRLIEPLENQNSEQFEIKERKRILNFKSGKTVKLNGDEFYTLADDGKTIRREFVRDVEIERCDRHLPRVPEWSEYPSWYVDPTTRGFNVTKLLSDFIGYDQYDVSLPPQPWRRPHCDKLEPDIEPVFVDSIKGIQFRDSYPANAQDQYQLRRLLIHINSGHVWPDSVGERILLAAEKAKTEAEEHLWLLYNTAALYWRVIGGNRQAIECLRRAVLHAPEKHQDIPLTQLAYIMYRFNLQEDTHQLLLSAIERNNTEPVTYLAWGIQQLSLNNATGAVTLLKYARDLDPTLQEAEHCLFIARCTALREKRGENKRLDNQAENENDKIPFWEKSWKPENWHESYLRGPEDDLSLNEKSFPGETEKERAGRMARRHSRFGEMAERLSLESELPVRVDQVELLLEIIEDELKFNNNYQNVESGKKDDDERLKYNIAANLIAKLTKVRDSEDPIQVIHDETSAAKDEL